MVGKISQMQAVDKLTLNALFEVVVQVAGTFKSRQVSLETIKRDLELSTGTAYELAVKYGFEGTEQEWLATLVGKSAYDIAVDQGFPGTQTEWIQALGALYSITPSVKGHVLVAGDTVGEWTPLDVPVVRALERLGFVVDDSGELVIDEGELTIRS